MAYGGDYPGRILYGASLSFTPSLPTAKLIVEMAFGYGPGATSPAWVDISSYVHSASWNRGRQNELNQIAAGTGQLLLHDRYSHFDPRNPSSPFYPNVRPGTPVRAQLTVSGVVYPLFVMSSERQPRTARVTTVYTERTIDLIDAFAVLANAGISGLSFPQQMSDQRVNAVLDAVAWPASNRQVGTGASILQPAEISGDAGETAASHLVKVSDSENGVFFIDGDGSTVFKGRHEFFRGIGPEASQATFRDLPGTPGYPCQDLVPSFDLDQVINKAVGTREGGEPQIVEDTASQQQYFLRERQFSSIVAYDAEVRNQMEWKLKLFSQPLDRIESITIMPLVDLRDSARIDASLGREVGDRITILETPPGFSVQQSNNYVIQHLEGHLVPGSAERPTLVLTFKLWPAAEFVFWRAGDAVQSAAGQTTWAAY